MLHIWDGRVAADIMVMQKWISQQRNAWVVERKCVLVCVHKKKLVQTKESSLEATKLLCRRHKPLSFLPFKGIQLPLTLCTPCRRWDNNDDGNLSLNELRGEETVNAILSIGKEVQKDRLVPRIGNEQMLLFSRSTSSKIKYRTSQWFRCICVCLHYIIETTFKTKRHRPTQS